MKQDFISTTFEPPREFNTDLFHFTVLEDKWAEQDYEAVMSSQHRLKGIFGPENDWPKKEMTLTENIKSLKVHKQEFESRQAFAYAVFNHRKNKYLGCVYIDPSQSFQYDCKVYLWVRDNAIVLDKPLYQTVHNWLKKEWAFVNIAFPGRVIS
jgi:hypothetical protein